eukprot:1837204-Amphidinium_carterae.1
MCDPGHPCHPKLSFHNFRSNGKPFQVVIPSSILLPCQTTELPSLTRQSIEAMPVTAPENLEATAD